MEKYPSEKATSSKTSSAASVKIVTLLTGDGVTGISRLVKYWMSLSLVVAVVLTLICNLGFSL